MLLFEISEPEGCKGGCAWGHRGIQLLEKVKQADCEMELDKGSGLVMPDESAPSSIC